MWVCTLLYNAKLPVMVAPHRAIGQPVQAPQEKGAGSSGAEASTRALPAPSSITPLILIIQRPRARKFILGEAHIFSKCQFSKGEGMEDKNLASAAFCRHNFSNSKRGGLPRARKFQVPAGAGSQKNNCRGTMQVWCSARIQQWEGVSPMTYAAGLCGTQQLLYSARRHRAGS